MKNSIFGAIVAVVVCACIFSILCVTDVISFNKNNKVNNTNNNTQKDVKETKLCETAKTVDGNEYRFVFYKLENGEKNNKVDFLVNNKSIYSYNLDYYMDVIEGIEENLMTSKYDCEKHFNDILAIRPDLFSIKNVTSDTKYNYYLFSTPYLNNLAISENKTTKEFKNLKAFGNAEDFGVVTYETYLSDDENKPCLDRKSIDVVDNDISEFELSKDDDIVYENQYTFKDGKIEKKTSNQKYYALCW